MDERKGERSIVWNDWHEFGIEYGFSLRGGGVSQPPFQSLNLGLHVGDQIDDVVENRRRLCVEIGVPFESWTIAEQVHGTNVHHVRAENRGKGRVSREDAIPDTDALICNQTNLLLTAVFADCVPIWFLDRKQKAIAIAHAGWRGTVAGVSTETIFNMQRIFGTDLNDLQVKIGPSIGGCCYEVDHLVAESVYQTIEGWPKKIKDTIILQGNRSDRWYLDLKVLNRQIMIERGVPSANIRQSTACTSCDTRRFFSHRAEQGRTGRMAAWIIRKSE